MLSVKGDSHLNIERAVIIKIFVKILEMLEIREQMRDQMTRFTIIHMPYIPAVF